MAQGLLLKLSRDAMTADTIVMSLIAAVFLSLAESGQAKDRRGRGRVSPLMYKHHQTLSVSVLLLGIAERIKFTDKVS